MVSNVFTDKISINKPRYICNNAVVKTKLK